MNNRALGTSYEEKAATYLTENSIQIIECNFRCRQGEIDLIGMDGKYLVFFEVKYRQSNKRGNPLEAVDLRKQKRISKVAAYYLYSHKYPSNTPCRFDVVGILEEEICWIKDAFPYCG